MKIAVITETDSHETRVAASAETVKKLSALGATFTIESGAGQRSGITDADYESAGASIAKTAKAALKEADIVLKVRRPNKAELGNIKKGAVVLAIMDPYGHDDALKAMAEAGIASFAMELMPRITRAQVMDVLSSQANLAGYRAVIESAEQFGRAFPMMMTAAGTVPAARVFVMGAGVAGLQAIATARRLGAVVTATDVRPASKEQVESLGAKFIAVEDDEFKQAETSGGYAKEMSKDYQAKQAALVAADMVASMRPGSVIVDLAVERGGNVEGVKPGEVAISAHDVKIVGHLNVPGRLAASSSQLYSKNLFSFLETMIDKTNKTLAINWDDELVKATNLTRDGHVVHPQFQPKEAAASA